MAEVFLAHSAGHMCPKTQVVVQKCLSKGLFFGDLKHGRNTFKLIVHTTCTVQIHMTREMTMAGQKCFGKRVGPSAERR